MSRLLTAREIQRRVCDRLVERWQAGIEKSPKSKAKRQEVGELWSLYEQLNGLTCLSDRELEILAYETECLIDHVPDDRGWCKNGGWNCRSCEHRAELDRTGLLQILHPDHDP